MARPPKGKPLTLRPIRLDADVWAECQRLGKEHGTINQGLRASLLGQGTPPSFKIKMSQRDFKLFLAALEADEEPSDKLRSLFQD